MVTSKARPASKPRTSDGEPRIDRGQLIQAIEEAIQEVLQKPRQESAKPGPRKDSPRVVKAPPRPALERGVQIQAWEDDPFLETAPGADPVRAEPIRVDLPENDHQLLQTHLLEQQPEPGLFEPSTPEFLYWNAASALARGINFWAPLLPEQTTWSSDQVPLQVELDHQETEDFNAFYARENGLNFFHGEVGQVTVFSGESPDVVCHELGHAILDALKPELFDAMSMEVAGFHEAFGDISSMLSALQLPSMRDFVLSQTGAELDANSRLSQLARQLGWAIRQDRPLDVDADSLRNASNHFFYQDPANLPPRAPANQLSSEPHSFSRVFSGAFLDVLASMFQVGPAGAPADNSARLLATSLDAGKLLVEGVRAARVGPGYYSQVAAGMIQADQILNGGRYRAALSSRFVQRGILSPAAAVSLARDLQAHAGQAFGISRAAGANHLQIAGDNEGYKKTAADAPALPVCPLATRFGVTIHVHLPAEPNRFGVAAAALSGGSEKVASAEEEARSFVEDLIQLDRISHKDAQGVFPAELTAPGEDGPCDKTHRLVKEDGKAILKRHHFCCGFPGRQRGS